MSLNAQNRAALEQELQDLKAMFNELNICALFLDAEMRLVRLTPQSRKLFALGPEALGQGLEVLGAALDVGALREPVQQVLATGQPQELEIKLLQEQVYQLEVRPLLQAAEPGVLLHFHNITALKQYQQELFESVQRFEVAFENSPVGKTMVDAQGQIFAVNQAFCQMLGYKREELLGKTFYELTHPEDLPQNTRDNQKLIQGEQATFETEKRYFAKDGSLVTCYVKATGVYSETGEFQYTVGQIINLSDLRAAEYNLASNAALLQQAFNHSPIAKALVHVDGTLFSVNPSFARMLGYSAEELQQKTFMEITHPEDLQKDFELFQALVRGEIETYDLPKRYLHKNGEQVWIHLYVSVVNNNQGGIDFIVAQIVDITERRAAALKLQQEQERLKLAESLASLGSWEIDLETGECIGSDEFYHLCGWPKDIAFRLDCLIKAFKPEQQPQIRATFAEAIAAQKGFKFNAHLVCPDGSLRAVISQGEIKLDTVNQAPKLMGSLLDVTQLQQQEHQLQAANDLLLRQNQQLESFTYIAAHNLRSPAANIVSLTELYQRSSLESERQKMVEMVQESAERLLHTLDTLAEAIKISKNAERELKQLQLETCFRQVISLLEGDILKHKVELQADFRACPQVWFAPLYLESILLNLISNAIKYASPARRPMVQVRSFWQDGQAVLEVRDNGLGIDLKRYGDKLFGLYKTFHHHPDARGVGLFLSKTQIEVLGGRIEVESQPGEGSVFRVFFKGDRL